MFEDRMVGDSLVLCCNASDAKGEDAKGEPLESHEESDVDVQQREPKKPLSITSFFYQEGKDQKKQNSGAKEEKLIALSTEKALNLNDYGFKQSLACNDSQNKRLTQRENQSLLTPNEEDSTRRIPECVIAESVQENLVKFEVSKKSKQESNDDENHEKVKCESNLNLEPDKKDIQAETEKKIKPVKWSLSWKPSTKSIESTKKKSSKKSNSSDSDFEVKNVKQIKRQRKKRKCEKHQFVEVREPVKILQKNGIDTCAFVGTVSESHLISNHISDCSAQGRTEVIDEVNTTQEISVKATTPKPSENKDVLLKSAQKCEESFNHSGPSVFEVLMKKSDNKDCNLSDQSLLASDTDKVKQSQNMEFQTNVTKSTNRKSREFKLSIRMAPKKSKDFKRGKKVQNCDYLDRDTEELNEKSPFDEQKKKIMADEKPKNKKDQKKVVNKRKNIKNKVPNSDKREDLKTSTMTLDGCEKHNKSPSKTGGKKKRAGLKTKEHTKAVTAVPKDKPKKVLKSSDGDFETIANHQSLIPLDRVKQGELERGRKKKHNKTRHKTVTEKKCVEDRNLTEPSRNEDINEVIHKEPSNEVLFVEDSLNTISAPVSCMSKEVKGNSEKSATEITEKPFTKEPVKLASIFMKPKADLKAKVLAKNNKTLTQDVSSAICSEKEPLLNASSPCVIDIDEANKVFSALFTGAGSGKSPAVTNTVELQTPAPWPVFNHINQEDDYLEKDKCVQSNSRVKRINLCESLHNEEPFLLSEMQCVDRTILGLLPSGETLGVNSKERNTKEVDEKLSEDKIKSLVTHLGTVHYPGIKIKRLYKRYKTKHDTQQASTELIANEKTLQSIAGDVILNSEPEEGRRKSKRKLSCSDSQSRTKIPRTELDTKTEAEIFCSHDEDSKVRRKRFNNREGQQVKAEESESLTPARRSKRLSGRLQKEQFSATDLERAEVKLSNEISTKKRKRQKITERSSTDSEERLPYNSTTFSKCIDNVKEAITSSSEKFMSADTGSMMADGNTKHIEYTQIPWTERYQPNCASEIMANANSVARLKSWLSEWKIKREKTLRKELEQQKKLLAKTKSKASSNKQGAQDVEWWDQESDSDFEIDDVIDDSDSDETQGLFNTMIITGARGAGKTAIVYALARELGYKVFEVNSTSKRSGKHILSQLEEATQSHQVIGGKAAAASMFLGAMKSPTENKAKIPSSSPLAAFLKPVVNLQEEQKAKKPKTKSGKSRKDRKEKKIMNTLSGNTVSVAAPNESNSSLSIKAASLILFEEVDVVFEEDKGFWAAVGSFMQNAKCPIIMTSDTFHLDCDGQYEHISIKPPSVPLLAAHLQLICLLNNTFISPHELKAFVAKANCDIRKCLLNLQFWVESGGGFRKPYLVNSKETNRHSSVKDSEVNEGSLSGEKNDASFLVGECSESQAVDDSSYPITENFALSKTDILSNPVVDEESMFLSIDEFKQIAEKGTKECSPAACSEFISNSCLAEKPRSSRNEVDGSGNLPVDVMDRVFLDTQFSPPAHHLLMEGTSGILNSHPDLTEGIIKFCERTFRDKCYLTNLCQSLGVNLLFSNLSHILPFLFTHSLTHNSIVPKQPVVTFGNAECRDKTGVGADECFQDKNLFDDGSGAQSEDVESRSKNNVIYKGNSLNTATVRTSSDIHILSSHKDITCSKKEKFICQKETECYSDDKKNKDFEKGTERYMKFASLEVFCDLAEDVSFMDAHTPNITLNNDQSDDFGWWHAKRTPDLVDTTCKCPDTIDWSTADTRSDLRGSIEIASMECRQAKFRSLLKRISGNRRTSNQINTIGNYSEEKGAKELTTKICQVLPPRDASVVLQMTSRDSARHTKSRDKLYGNVSSALPTLIHCSNRVIATEYLPSLRAICHSERLRETAKTKRRFLHYLDANSFTISRSTQASLADAFLLK